MYMKLCKMEGVVDARDDDIGRSATSTLADFKLYTILQNRSSCVFEFAVSMLYIYERCKTALFSIGTLMCIVKRWRQ